MKVKINPYASDCDNCGQDTHMTVAFDWGDLVICPCCQQKLVCAISKAFEVNAHES
jgi:predicted nucleic acid-binding Zn ribbon protein